MLRVLFFIFTIAYSASLWALTASECHQQWNIFLAKKSLRGEYRELIDHCDQEFRTILHNLISSNIDRGYWAARNFMFSTLDNVDGQVCGVYSDVCIFTNGIPERQVMNCEHTWPQSRGAVGMAKVDLHHLFPVTAHFNSRRNNHPFCDVVVVHSAEDGSLLGDGQDGTRCFEPRNPHKGDVARAMFYFAVRYNKHIDLQQEKTLRRWYRQDVVSEKEIKRNNMIEEFQGNRNPFIDFPEFINFVSDF